MSGHCVRTSTARHAPHWQQTDTQSLTVKWNALAVVGPPAGKTVVSSSSMSEKSVSPCTGSATICNAFRCSLTSSPFARTCASMRHGFDSRESPHMPATCYCETQHHDGQAAQPWRTRCRSRCRTGLQRHATTQHSAYQQVPSTQADALSHHRGLPNKRRLRAVVTWGTTPARGGPRCYNSGFTAERPWLH